MDARYEGWRVTTQTNSGNASVSGMEFSYNSTPRLSLFLNARNVFNVPNITIDRGSQTPACAQQALLQEYGVPFSIGLKGLF